MILEGHPARIRKVNVVGLERLGYSRQDVQPLRDAFKEIYRGAEPRSRVLARLAPIAGTNELVRDLIRFVERTGMGAKGRYRESQREEYARQGRERIFGGVEA